MDRCSSFDILTERLTIYILENIAYGIPAISSTSTETYQGIERSAKNAVDEDPDTYALTKSETNPQVTVTLADIFKIGHIYISLTIGKYRITPHSVIILTPPLSGNSCFKSSAIISGFFLPMSKTCNHICKQFTSSAMC